MNIKDIEPGRYPCKISDFGLEEVEKIRAVKVVISIEFITPELEGVQMKWESFLLRKDGTPNKKTIDTLKAAGLKAGIESLATDPMALDKNKELFATVILDDKGYKRIEWLNSADEGHAMNKISDVKKIQGMDLRKFNDAMGVSAKAPIKNHAPKPSDDQDIPF